MSTGYTIQCSPLTLLYSTGCKRPGFTGMSIPKWRMVANAPGFSGMSVHILTYALPIVRWDCTGIHTRVDSAVIGRCLAIEWPWSA